MEALLNPGTNGKRFLLLGEHHDVAVQPPLLGHGPLRYYWADKGLVHCESEADNSYSTFSWEEAALRLSALMEVALRSSEEGYDSAQMRRLKTFIEDMRVVISKAKFQGGPNDPGAAEDYVRRRPKMFVIGSNIGSLT